MHFQFDECVQVLFTGLYDSLKSRVDEIRSLHKSEPLWAISYDLIPWDPFVGVAFRLESESSSGASENSADWKLSHFLETVNQPALRSVEDYIHRVSEESLHSRTCDPRDITHLIFLAGAVALLDERIALLLQSCGVNAPTIRSKLESTYFKYFVFDPDGVVRSNYCDIVRASRATHRLLGRVV